MIHDQDIKDLACVASLRDELQTLKSRVEVLERKGVGALERKEDDTFVTTRIIETDNFGGDYPNECFLGGFGDEPLEVSIEAEERIVDVLNKDAGPNAPRFYRAVPRDYTLVPGFQP